MEITIMRTRLFVIVGGAALLAGCTVSSQYQPAVGYSEAPVTYQTYPATYQTYPATYQTYPVAQPTYQVTTYYAAPAPAYTFYSPEGAPTDANDGSGSK
jgi:hypothetical protein